MKVELQAFLHANYKCSFVIKTEIANLILVHACLIFASEGFDASGKTVLSVGWLACQWGDQRSVTIKKIPYQLQFELREEQI